MIAAESLPVIQAASLADSERWFPALHASQDTLATHFTLGLIGEAGEVANLVKKVKRGDATWAEMRGRLGDEMADVLTYLCDLAAALDLDLAEEWAKKRAFNEERFG